MHRSNTRSKFSLFTCWILLMSGICHSKTYEIISPNSQAKLSVIEAQGTLYYELKSWLKKTNAPQPTQLNPAFKP